MPAITPEANPADDKAIREIVAACETAWNASDSAGFTAHMADDVDFINVLGDRHKGRVAIERGHRHIFDTIYKDSRVHYTIDAIRFLRPDIALAFVHARLLSKLAPAAIASTTRESQIGATMHEAQARPTIVLAKDAGEWRIVAFHNTSIAAPP